MNDIPHGKGIVYYKDGKVKYDGYINNGKVEGFGKYFYENGEYYLGDWLKGKKNGKGILCYKNNTIKYEGDFVNDKKEGKGKYIYEDGNYL